MLRVTSLRVTSLRVTSLNESDSHCNLYLISDGSLARSWIRNY